MRRVIIVAGLTVCGMVSVLAQSRDNTPPQWYTTPGVQFIQDKVNGVALFWNNAYDTESMPVYYNAYFSETSPAVEGTKLAHVTPISGAPHFQSQYVVTGAFLGENIWYHFAVRAEDSASPPNEDANTVEQTMIWDTLPPYVNEQNPAMGATAVPVDSTVSFHLRDDGLGVSYASIEMRIDGEVVTYTRSGPPQDYLITYHPTAPFNEYQTVGVTINAYDTSARHNAMSPVVYFFTTLDAAAPTPVSLFPAPSQTAVPTNAALSFYMVDHGAGVLLSSFNVAVSGVPIVVNGVDQTGGRVTMDTGNLKNMQFVYRPASAFAPNQVVPVTISVSDANSPPNVMTPLNYSFTAGTSADQTPPTWIATTGIRHAEGVGDTAIMVSWNSATDASSPNITYNVYYRHNQSPPWTGTRIENVRAEAGEGYDFQYRIEGLEIHELYSLGVRAADSMSPPNEDTNNVFLWANAHDTVTPYLDQLDPSPNETGVSVNTPIEFHIKDDGAGVELSSIHMTVYGIAATPTITGSPEDYHVIFRRFGPYGERATVPVTIAARDLANPSNEMTPFSYTFVTRDMTAPFTSNQVPRMEEQNLARNMAIGFHIEDAVTGVDQTLINILIDDAYIIQSGVDQTGGYASLVDVNGDHKDYRFYVGLPTPFDAFTTYQITVVAGDLETPPNGLAQTYTLTTGNDLDSAPPYVSDELPPPDGHGYANMPIGFHVRDDKAGVFPESLNVVVNGQPVIVNGADVTGGDVTIGGERFDYDISYIPDPPYNPGDTIEVSIDARDATSPGNIMTTVAYSFDIVDDTDSPALEQIYPLPDSTDSYRNGNVHMLVKDYQTGVDGNTIQLWINGTQVYPTSLAVEDAVGDEDRTSPVVIWDVPFGYEVVWRNAGQWPASFLIPVRVVADDRNPTPNHMDVSYSFTAGSGRDDVLPECTISDPVYGQILTGDTYTVHGSSRDDESGVYLVEFNYASSEQGYVRAAGLETWQYNWRLAITDGTYYIKARASDNANNRFETIPVQVFIDRLPPTSFLLTPQADSYVEGESIIISGTATDLVSGVDHVEVSIDGGATWLSASGTATWSYRWYLPASGDFVLQSRATDRGGNVEEPGNGITVHVDNLAPSSHINDPHSGDYIHGPVYTISGAAADTGSGVAAVAVTTDNGQTWGPVTGLETFTYLWNLPADGQYSLNSRATDRVGNQETPGAPIVVTVDNTAPSSAITSPTAQQYINAAQFTVTGTAQDNLAGLLRVEFSAGGGVWSQATGLGSWTYPWTTPTDGVYQLQSRATDLAQNVETPAAGVSVTVDKTAPVSHIASPADNAYYRTPSVVNVTGTASDNLAGVNIVQLSTDGGGSWSPAVGTDSWTFQWTLPVQDGTYTVRSRAEDRAGNAETPTSIVHVILDATAPQSTITFPQDGGCAGGSAFVIQGTANDVTSGVQQVEVSVDDGASWHTASGTTDWTYQWSTPNSGTFTLRSRATDRAGNLETPAPGNTITIDNLAPQSSITDPLAGALLHGSTYAILGTASDQGCGMDHVDISVDNGVTWNRAQGTTSWSYSWTLPTEGSFTLKSRAVDQATNQEVPGSGVTVRVDNAAPVSVITSPQNDAVLGAAITVSGTAQDNLAGVAKVEVSFDEGGTWVQAEGTTSWSYEYTALVEGELIIRSRATDLAGNVEVPAAGVTVTVDLTGPNILVGGYWDTYITGQGGSLTILAFCLDDDLDYIELYYLGTPTGLRLLDDGTQGDWTAGDGIYSFAVSDVGVGAPSGTLDISFRAFDRVGNWSEWPALEVK